MNLPNSLTLLRLVLVPVYAVLFYYTQWHLATLIIFMIAAATDWVDGYLARKMNLITDLGKLMDPLADKILTISAFILMSSLGFLNPLIVILIVARELMISIFRAVAASKHVVIAASIYGKSKTVLQFMSIIVFHLMRITDFIPNFAFQILVVLMTLATLMSGVDYLVKNRKVIL